MWSGRKKQENWLSRTESKFVIARALNSKIPLWGDPLTLRAPNYLAKIHLFELLYRYSDAEVQVCKYFYIFVVFEIFILVDLITKKYQHKDPLFEIPIQHEIDVHRLFSWRGGGDFSFLW